MSRNGETSSGSVLIVGVSVGDFVGTEVGVSLGAFDHSFSFMTSKGIWFEVSVVDW